MDSRLAVPTPRPVAQKIKEVQQLMGQGFRKAPVGITQVNPPTQKRSANGSLVEQIFSHLLAALRAAQQSHWTSHWQVEGESFYADHQLFERLYSSLTEEIDTLAEKMVASLGKDAVDLPGQMKWQAFLAQEWAKTPDLFYRAYHIEQYLQEHFKKTYDALKQLDQLTLGLDDFLMATANAHETNMYLLGQRVGDRLAHRRASLESMTGKFPKSIKLNKTDGRAVTIPAGFEFRVTKVRGNKAVFVRTDRSDRYSYTAPLVTLEKFIASRTARNQQIIETPHNFHPVKVEPPKGKSFEGFIDFQGILIDVENVKGSTRRGEGPSGEWATYMHSHYGEIRGTEGVDGDKLDVYVGDNHDSSVVVVIHQHNPWDGKYDEDKVMLGFDSVEEAIGAYKKQYNRPGFYIMDGHTAMNAGAFWRWVKDTRNKGKKVTAMQIAEDIVYRADPRKGWFFIESGGDLGHLTMALDQEMIRRVPPPQSVAKVSGARKAFSFHWSNAQRKWDVINVSQQLPWGIDGAEFIVFVGSKATSPTGKLWTLPEMRYVALGLNRHPGYANSPESAGGGRSRLAMTDRQYLNAARKNFPDLVGNVFITRTRNGFREAFMITEYKPGGPKPFIAVPHPPKDWWPEAMRRPKGFSVRKVWDGLSQPGRDILNRDVKIT